MSCRENLITLQSSSQGKVSTVVSTAPQLIPLSNIRVTLAPSVACYRKMKCLISLQETCALTVPTISHAWLLFQSSKITHVLSQIGGILSDVIHYRKQ